MSDEDGIRRTIANYCRLFDSKQWDELGKIFAKDASVTSRRGTYTDTLTKSGDSWLLASKEIRLK